MVDHSKPVDFELTMAGARADVPRLAEAMEFMRGQYPLYAQQYRAYYDALIAQKFSSEEAIRIVMAHGWIPK